MWIGWVTCLKKRLYQTSENCMLLFWLFVVSQCPWLFLKGANSSRSWNWCWGSDLPDRLAFFTIDQMGFTGGSNLAADLTHISSAHGNFWSLICLVTTAPADTEVRTWHCGLCKWFLCVAQECSASVRHSKRLWTYFAELLFKNLKVQSINTYLPNVRVCRGKICLPRIVSDWASHFPVTCANILQSDLFLGSQQFCKTPQLLPDSSVCCMLAENVLGKQLLSPTSNLCYQKGQGLPSCLVFPSP